MGLFVAALAVMMSNNDLDASDKKGRQKGRRSAPAAEQPRAKAPVQVVATGPMKQPQSEQKLIESFERFANNSNGMVEPFLKKEFADQGFGQLYVHKNGQTDFLNVGQILTVRRLYSGILKKLADANKQADYTFWDGNAKALLKFAEGPAKKSGHQWIEAAPKDLAIAQAAGQKNSGGTVSAEVAKQVETVIEGFPKDVEGVNSQAEALGNNVATLEQQKQELQRLSELVRSKEAAVGRLTPGGADHQRAVQEFNEALAGRNKAAGELQQGVAKAVDGTVQVVGGAQALAQTADQLATEVLPASAEGEGQAGQQKEAEIKGVGKWREVLQALPVSPPGGLGLAEADYDDQTQFLQTTSSAFSDLSGIKPNAKTAVKNEAVAVGSALEQLANLGYRWYMAAQAKGKITEALVEEEYKRITQGNNDTKEQVIAVNAILPKLWEAEKAAFNAQMTIVKFVVENPFKTEWSEQEKTTYKNLLEGLNEGYKTALERLVNTAQPNWHGVLKNFGLLGNSELAGYLAWMYWPTKTEKSTADKMREAQQAMSTPIDYNGFMWQGVDAKNKEIFGSGVYPYLRWTFDKKQYDETQAAAAAQQPAPSAPPIEAGPAEVHQEREVVPEGPSEKPQGEEKPVLQTF